MSRSGRATELLTEWRDHPRGCTAEHGFNDGYDGPCTDDPWDIVQVLDMIDPLFRQGRTPPTGADDPTWLRPSREPVGACYDCGLDYGGPGWADAVVPTDVWVRISPTGNEGGLLCVTCMARRIEYLGLDDVPLLVGSGPWLYEPEVWRLDGLRQGREQVLAEFRREAQHADRVGNDTEAALVLDIAAAVGKTLGMPDANARTH